jgi:adenylate cyclase
MSDRWQLRAEDAKSVYVAELTGPAEIGRQAYNDEKPPEHFQFKVRGREEDKDKDGWRVVIAPREENTISRKHLGVKPLPDGRFQLSNLSTNQVIGLPNNQELPPGGSFKASLPVALRVGNKTVRLTPIDEGDLASLPMATMAPGALSLLVGIQATMAGRSKMPGSMETDQLMEWLQTFLGLLHSAAGSEDFYTKAARALVDLVKLDSGRVLFRNGMEWQEQTVQSGTPIPQQPWRPSTRVLSGVLEHKKTHWQLPAAGPGASTSGVDAVVAAPILNRKGEVIGALYGERRADSLSHGKHPLSMLDAMLVEVLASGVAAGLARVNEEQAAIRARTQMEQYFGPGKAAKLVDHPELLVGRDTEVSVLFCDIRGFSGISEKLGPEKTVKWIGDIMSVLSQCVLDHEGVVLDYIGDELMAMWGAPEDQPDHAKRACRSALAMMECLPGLNERWQSTLGVPLNLGVGINSGVARVGNTGSTMKFKYGALGNTVNLASRVQGATKHLKVPLLITEATQAKLDSSFATRRLCQVCVVNIKQPVTLYELAAPNNDSWGKLRTGYEDALTLFHKSEFGPATALLGRLIADYPNDGPTLLLLSRAVACLVEEPESFDPVMVLSGK